MPKEAKYKLKRVLGVSDHYYTHCEFFPIYGTYLDHRQQHLV
jgi:hypothetical protein